MELYVTNIIEHRSKVIEYMILKWMHQYMELFESYI